MKYNIKNTFRAGLVVATGLVAMNSCTDTWNDHYDAKPMLTFEGTTMQAIEQNASDFAKVIKAYGYERELASENIYTVWAPQNGTFNLSDYVDSNGRMCADSAEVVKQFIKNHVARYAQSLGTGDIAIDLMNQKKGKMTADGTFEMATIAKSNISCSNGVLHVLSSVAPYRYNLFELIAKQYKDDTTEGKDTMSLYQFLYDPTVNSDSLIENKSVSSDVDADGNKIWVDSFVMRNNTVLKNVDAKLYEEDSSFIAILPSAKAWGERYKFAESLLKFNPFEDTRAEGACDSLQRHYANRFAMTDLFFNKNANEHWEDSLKSTNYSSRTWTENVYYSKMPKAMPEDKELNDILSKVGTPFNCSNGDGYMVDEYPMTAYEQFFKKIQVSADARSIDLSLDSKGNTEFTKNVSTSFRKYPGTLTSAISDTLGNVISRKTFPYSYVDIVPSSGSVNPYVAFQIKNTLSGEYDLYLVTCPIWLSNNLSNLDSDELDVRPYRFYTYIYERQNSGKEIGQYPASGVRLANPDGSGNYFITNPLPRSEEGLLMPTDTTYLGSYTFSNAYYGRNDEGVLIQLQSQITSKLTKDYSREMLISTLILKPRKEGEAPVVIAPAEAKAIKRNNLIEKVTINRD